MRHVSTVLRFLIKKSPSPMQAKEIFLHFYNKVLNLKRFIDWHCPKIERY